MPRKKLIRTKDYPYHVYSRSNNKDYFLIDLNLLWPICLKYLKEIKDRYNANIISFVLMNNHYHLVLSTPDENLSDCMTHFNREISKNANKLSGRINHFFGGKYKWSLIINENYFWNAIKYVFRNPVHASITKNVETYKYSSLNDIQSELWNITDFFNCDQKVILNIDWLNKAYNPKDEEKIKNALSKNIFSYPKSRSGKLISDIPIDDTPFT